jgi:hypothetical protein
LADSPISITPTNTRTGAVAASGTAENNGARNTLTQKVSADDDGSQPGSPTFADTRCAFNDGSGSNPPRK